MKNEVNAIPNPTSDNCRHAILTFCRCQLLDFFSRTVSKFDLPSWSSFLHSIPFTVNNFLWNISSLTRYVFCSLLIKIILNINLTKLESIDMISLIFQVLCIAKGLSMYKRGSIYPDEMLHTSLLINFGNISK